MTTNVAEPVTKRAIELVVGDRIERRQLPRMFGDSDPEIVFIKDQLFRRESFVFVAVAYDDGYHDSTSFLSGAEIKVFSAVDPQECTVPGCTDHYVGAACPVVETPEESAAIVDHNLRAAGRAGLRDRRTCVDPGDQEHDHEACKDVVAEEREARPLVSDATIAEAAAMEERDRLAGGPPWEVPEHPDNSLPGGWHHGQIR